MKKPDYPLNQPMQVHNTADKALPFQHNGSLYTLPLGVSEWPFEIAERLERKFGSQGVRIVFNGVPVVETPAEPVVEVVAESTPAVEVEQPLDTPASTDVETPAEPDPPAEPKEP